MCVFRSLSSSQTGALCASVGLLHLQVLHDTLNKQHRNHITTFYVIDFTIQTPLWLWFFSPSLLFHFSTYVSHAFFFSIITNKSFKRIESYHKMIVCASETMYWKMTKKLLTINNFSFEEIFRIENKNQNTLWYLICFPFQSTHKIELWIWYIHGNANDGNATHILATARQFI